MTDKNELNRRRKWAPKARTGCRTCKTRHVKCDEGKPRCKRCELSGFRCDGYPSVPRKQESNGSPSGEDSTEAAESSSPDTQNSPILITSTIDLHAHVTDSPTELSPSVISPTEPYINNERRSLQMFIHTTAAMVSRSPSAPHFWQKLVPQAAWSFPSVRHAMLAASIACESLMRRESVTVGRRQSSLQVLNHTSKAIQSLLSDRPPWDVVLLTSATLGIMDLFNGHWDAACTHVTSGAKLAAQARMDPVSDPFISFYCEAFASALPGILKKAQSETDTKPAYKNNLIRLSEATSSLRLAMTSFENVVCKLERHTGPDKDRIMILVQNAMAETTWILGRWEKLYHDEVKRKTASDDEIQVNIHRVESPWSAIMQELDLYLKMGGQFDITKFEIVMGRTIPFYTLSKSGPNVKMREDAVELMYRSLQIRRKSGQLSPGSPHAVQRLITLEEIET